MNHCSFCGGELFIDADMHPCCAQAEAREDIACSACAASQTMGQRHRRTCHKDDCPCKG